MTPTTQNDVDKKYKTVIPSILIHSWWCMGSQKKQNSSRISTLLSNCAVFQPKWKKLWKTIKKVLGKSTVWRFFKVYSILAEKQRNLTTNSSSLIFSALLPPKSFPGGICKEDMTDFTFLFGIFQLWRHLTISNFFQNKAWHHPN